MSAVGVRQLRARAPRDAYGSIAPPTATAEEAGQQLVQEHQVRQQMSRSGYGCHDQGMEATE